MYRFDYLPLCTIAGSDPTGGAGAQGDLRTFAAHGGHGTAVITAVTVQGRAGLQVLHPLPAALVGRQLSSALAESEPRALKIGMLADGAILDAVADGLDAAPGRPLILDPVLSAGAGGVLLDEAAVDRLAARLAPHTSLLTPNLPEATRLLGRDAIDPEQPEEAALALVEAGWRAVLLKGGHASGREAVDVLARPEGVTRFAHRRLALGDVHGTGCALSASIAARIGRGEALGDAVEGAISYLQQLLRLAEESGQWLLPHLGAGLPQRH